MEYIKDQLYVAFNKQADYTYYYKYLGNDQWTGGWIDPIKVAKDTVPTWNTSDLHVLGTATKHDPKLTEELQKLFRAELPMNGMVKKLVNLEFTWEFNEVKPKKLPPNIRIINKRNDI
jgi:hypothetical protein